MQKNYALRIQMKTEKQIQIPFLAKKKSEKIILSVFGLFITTSENQ